jgi:hypothetical protein
MITDKHVAEASERAPGAVADGLAVRQPLRHLRGFPTRNGPSGGEDRTWHTRPPLAHRTLRVRLLALGSALTEPSFRARQRTLKRVDVFLGFVVPDEGLGRKPCSFG